MHEKKVPDFSFIRELLEGADKEKLAEFLHEIGVKKEEKQQHKYVPEHGPVKIYTTVIKHYNCICCGHRQIISYKLAKGEEISTINSDGTIRTLTAVGKNMTVHIASTTTRCNFCSAEIRSWSREKLEARYLSIIGICAYKEVYGHIAEDEENSVEGEVVDISSAVII
jgi:hypothetical protein